MPACANTHPEVYEGVRKFLHVLADGGQKPELMNKENARGVLAGAQASVKYDHQTITKRITIKCSEIQPGYVPVEFDSLDLVIVRPKSEPADKVLPFFMFHEGGGWVLGNKFEYHERLVTDLVLLSGCAAVYVDYTPAPEAKFPVAVHQAFVACKYMFMNGSKYHLDTQHMGIAGNSVGGNMTIAVGIQARDDPAMKHAVKFMCLLWPVTDSNFYKTSFRTFKNDHFLDGRLMEWMWDLYTTPCNGPCTEFDATKMSEADKIKSLMSRANILASPLQASLEQLKGLPPTYMQVSGCDILRDEGEAFAKKLDT